MCLWTDLRLAVQVATESEINVLCNSCLLICTFLFMSFRPQRLQKMQLDSHPRIQKQQNRSMLPSHTLVQDPKENQEEVLTNCPKLLGLSAQRAPTNLISQIKLINS